MRLLEYIIVVAKSFCAEIDAVLYKEYVANTSVYAFLRLRKCSDFFVLRP